MALTLQQLNSASPEEGAQMLDGLYEHSPWIAQAALAQRPFQSLADLQFKMVQRLTDAGEAAQLALIRAHPALAGQAMLSQTLTPASKAEQDCAGLTHCSPEELATIEQLNAAYQAKFGFGFILAVRGPRGTGLKKQEIMATFQRRLNGSAHFELQECLRNIHRIVEIRLNDKFGAEPTQGNLIWDWHEALAMHTEPSPAEKKPLTVTYLTAAHRACAAEIKLRMQTCGCDEVQIDAVGNVVGRYRSSRQTAPTLLTGSHYDTVRNGGKYDGRLGIFVPLACVRELASQGKRLPFHLEIVAFAEEEGQRFNATFLGASALIGQFDPRWLAQTDAEGITLREAMADAGLAVDAIAQLKRQPADYLGFVEVHIEQGPVLNELNLPLGVVTAINGSLRYSAQVIGTACHAGTTPMNKRQDAAAAVAELILAVEKRALENCDTVATVGQLHVPSGATNVVPGQCHFTLDVRAPTDALRDALAGDILATLQAISVRRQVSYSVTETMRADAAPSAPDWQARWESALQTQGLPIHRLPSGAGHDAMKLHELMPQAMLFVRGQNAGISHNPLESTTNNDMQLAYAVFLTLLTQLDLAFNL